MSWGSPARPWAASITATDLRTLRVWFAGPMNRPSFVGSGSLDLGTAGFACGFCSDLELPAEASSGFRASARMGAGASSTGLFRVRGVAGCSNVILSALLIVGGGWPLPNPCSLETIIRQGAGGTAHLIGFLFSSSHFSAKVETQLLHTRFGVLLSSSCAPRFSRNKGTRERLQLLQNRSPQARQCLAGLNRENLHLHNPQN